MGWGGHERVTYAKRIMLCFVIQEKQKMAGFWEWEAGNEKEEGIKVSKRKAFCFCFPTPQSGTSLLSISAAASNKHDVGLILQLYPPLVALHYLPFLFCFV